MDKTRKTIGNPASWLLDAALGTVASTGAAPPRDAAAPRIASGLGTADIRAALRAGAEDFVALRSDVVFLVLFYPVAGAVLAVAALNRDLLPLIFPMIAGFALLGPVFATGLYEMSRRRARGEAVGWAAAFGVVRSPGFPAILGMGLALSMLFMIWIATAMGLYGATLGPEPPASLAAFARDVVTTGAGWTMLIAGCATGFVFAALALAISVISIPLLLDRQVSLPQAVAASLELTRRNPAFVAGWGLVVAVALVLGSLPAFLGLVFVLPVLGHGTWHLYRRAVR